MSKELLIKLLEYIDAKVDAESYEVKTSSDHGLMEHMKVSKLKEELETLCNQ